MSSPLLALILTLMAIMATAIALAVISIIGTELITDYVGEKATLAGLSAFGLASGYLTIRFLMFIPNGLLQGELVSAVGRGMLGGSLLAVTLGALGIIPGLIDYAAGGELTNPPSNERGI